MGDRFLFNTKKPKVTPKASVPVVQVPKKITPERMVEGIVEATMDTVEESSRTIQAMVEVMQDVKESMNAVDRAVERCTEVTRLTANIVQQIAHDTKDHKEMLKYDHESTRKVIQGTEAAIRQCGEMSKKNAAVMDAAITRMEQFNSIIGVSRDAVNGINESISGNKTAIQALTKSADDMGDKVSKAVQIAHDTAEEASNVVRLNTTVIEAVLARLKKSFEKTTEPPGWSKLNVSIMRRDYNGQILELEVRKE